MHLRSPRLAVAAAFAALLAQPAHAGPSTSDPTAALRAAADADDLTLAALVSQRGDDAVLAALTQHEDVLLRASAVRGSTFMRSAALALPGLVEIAAGRDPDLAPMAARRAAAISRSIAEASQRGGEGDKGRYTAASQGLSAIADAEGTDREIRVLAGEASAMLQAARTP